MALPSVLAQVEQGWTPWKTPRAKALVAENLVLHRKLRSVLREGASLAAEAEQKSAELSATLERSRGRTARLRAEATPA